MKTIKFLSLFALILILALSCSTDDATKDPDPIEQIDPIEEETPEEEISEEVTSNEPSNILTENVLIAGSEKIEGTPPTPNGSISLDLSSATKFGLPEEGFDIDFTSDTNVIGAYIQFKTTDAAVADSYFDIDLIKNAEGSKSTSKQLSKLKLKERLTKKLLVDDPINIGFTPQLQTGEICYVICVYDNAGNISNPQEVCVTVNSWGGNDDLVGTWNLTHNVDLSEDGTDTETVGVEDCDDSNASTSFCYLIDYWTLTLNADGTFENSIKEFEREEANEPNFSDYSIETVKGNWSYDVASETLLFAVYYDEYQENNAIIESETYEIGDADVFESQRIILDATSLHLIWDEVDTNGDGTIDESYIEYYEKQ